MFTRISGSAGYSWQDETSQVTGAEDQTRGGTERLPLRRITDQELSVSAWWLGVHGGAGESTLQALYAGSRACEHRWPIGPVGAPARVVLVARTNAHGVQAVQAALRDLSARRLSVTLGGLVLIADAPGRLPHELRELAALVSGAIDPVWRFPWVHAWRLGEPPSATNAPREATRLLADFDRAAALTHDVSDGAIKQPRGVRARQRTTER